MTLGPHRLLEQPPAVQRAEFRWSGEPGEPASILLRPPPERAALADTLWRLRIAALAPGPVHLLDVQTAGAAAVGGGAVEYRWTPTEAEGAALRAYYRGHDPAGPTSGSRTSSGRWLCRRRWRGSGQRR